MDLTAEKQPLLVTMNTAGPSSEPVISLAGAGSLAYHTDAHAILAKQDGNVHQLRLRESVADPEPTAARHRDSGTFPAVQRYVEPGADHGSNQVASRRTLATGVGQAWARQDRFKPIL